MLKIIIFIFIIIQEMEEVVKNYSGKLKIKVVVLILIKIQSEMIMKITFMRYFYLQMVSILKYIQLENFMHMLRQERVLYWMEKL